MTRTVMDSGNRKSNNSAEAAHATASAASTGNKINNNNNSFSSWANDENGVSPWLDVSNDDVYCKHGGAEGFGGAGGGGSVISRLGEPSTSCTAWDAGDDRNNDKMISNDRNDAYICYDQEHWNEVERMNDIQRQLNVYRQIRERYKNPFQIRFLRFVVVYIFVYGIDCITTMLIGLYLLIQLLFLVLAKATTLLQLNHTYANEDNLSTEQLPPTADVETAVDGDDTNTRRRVVIVVSTIFLWYLARTLTAAIGIMNYRSGCSSSRANSPNNTNSSRALLWISSRLISPMTAFFFIASGCVYTAIVRGWTRLPSTYIGDYVFQHRQSLLPILPDAAATSIVKRYIVRYLTSSQYLWWIWLSFFVLVAIEVLRSYVLSQYRHFLLNCDEMLMSYYSANNNEGGGYNCYDINSGKSNFMNDTCNESIIESAWENLREPLVIGPSSLPTNFDHYRLEESQQRQQQQRYGIPGWVGTTFNNYRQQKGENSFQDVECDPATSVDGDISLSWNNNNNNNNNNNSKYRNATSAFILHRQQQQQRNNGRSPLNDTPTSYFTKVFRPFLRRGTRGGKTNSVQHGDYRYVDSDNQNSNNITVGDDNESDGFNFASIQEEWATLSEDDPFWWSRDNTYNKCMSSNNNNSNIDETSSRNNMRQQPQQLRKTLLDPEWIDS